MKVVIKIFEVGLKYYKHVMNTERDSVELRDERDGILLNYDAEARVTSHQERMGSFNVEYIDGQPCWVYYELPLHTRIVFGPDLPTAELEVSKRYLRKFNSIATELGQMV